MSESDPGETWVLLGDYDADLSARFELAQRALRASTDLPRHKYAPPLGFDRRSKGTAEKDQHLAQRATTKPPKVRREGGAYAISAHELLSSEPDTARPGRFY